MHFHDSFIAHFFPVFSLSCCHKQTSAVLLLFIIHKSNKVASQDSARRHFSTTVFSYYVLCPYLFRPLSRGSILYSRLHFSSICLPSVCARKRHKNTKTTFSAAFVDTFIESLISCADKICQQSGGNNKSSIAVHVFSITVTVKCVRNVLITRRRHLACESRAIRTRRAVIVGDIFSGT